MKNILVVFAFGLASAHAAEPPSAHQGISSCHKFIDIELRRKCYDEVSGYADPIKEEDGKPDEVTAEGQVLPPIAPITFRVRNDGRYDGYFGASIGSKNGEVSYQRNSGKNHVSANVAVQAIFRPINDYGLQPFASARWQRIDNKSKESDIRDLSLGLDMPLGDPKTVGFFITPRYIHRTDIYGETDSRLFTTHGNVVKKSWVKVGDDSELNYSSFIPYFGAIYEQRKPSNAKWDEWSGAYLGFEWSAQWNRLTPRLQSTAKYQYFWDFSRPSGSQSRDGDYGMISISYEFTDPEDASVTVRPAIFLTREVGMNPVSSAERINQTTLGFGLKVN